MKYATGLSLRPQKAVSEIDRLLMTSMLFSCLLVGGRMLRTGHNTFCFLILNPLFWLNALGVYIGRYLRYNSWDVIVDPFRLFRDIASILIHPLRNDYAWGMIFCFSILMTLMYLMLKRISLSLA